MPTALFCIICKRNSAPAQSHTLITNEYRVYAILLYHNGIYLQPPADAVVMTDVGGPFLSTTPVGNLVMEYIIYVQIYPMTRILTVHVYIHAVYCTD